MTDTAKSYELTKAAARSIIDAQKREHDAITAKLRAARLEKEVSDMLNHTPGKPRAKAIKTKVKKF